MKEFKTLKELWDHLDITGSAVTGRKDDDYIILDNNKIVKFKLNTYD